MASSSVPVASPVERAVRAAAIRKLVVDTAEELGWTLLIVLSGVALLLLLGSNVFAPQWLLFLVVIGLSITAWRLRKRRLLPYQVAQLLDYRLHLHDSLSTAYFLRSRPVILSDVATSYQLQQADQLASTVKPEASFPFSGSRIWIAAGTLAVISSGLFGTRYLVTRSLNVAPSLIPLQMPAFFEPVTELFGGKKDKADKLASTEQSKAKAKPANGPDSQSDKQKEPGTESHAGGASPDGSATPSPNAGDNAKTGAPQGDAEGKAGQNDQSQRSTGSERASSAPKDGRSSSKALDSAGHDDGKKQSPNGGNAPGLMNRMKDAMSSLMAKMQASTAQQQAQSSAQQGGSDDKPGDQSKAQGQPKAGKESEQQKAQDGASNPSETAESQAQGQGAEKQGTSQGKSSSDQSAQKGADAHSGVGQQDGDKAIKDAEDLKAMGKLADIIGKRSAELTGEMTVETSSGKQQLKTNYSGRVGQHFNSGGEINRDEVPLRFQSYVREYMEQVRKGVKGVQ